MLEPKKITVDGMHFQVHPLPAMRALQLDKQVVTLLLPVLNGLDDFSIDAKLDLKSVSEGLQQSLGKMDAVDFDKLVMGLLHGTVYLPEKGAPEDISPEVFDNIFRGKLLTVYKLLFEVMKFNKFSPFMMVAGGFGMTKILTSKGQTENQKGNGN